MITIKFWNRETRSQEYVTIEYDKNSRLRPTCSRERVQEFFNSGPNVNTVIATGVELQDIINKMPNIPYVKNQDRGIPQVWRGDFASFIADNLIIDWGKTGDTE